MAIGHNCLDNSDSSYSSRSSSRNSSSKGDSSKSRLVLYLHRFPLGTRGSVHDQWITVIQKQVLKYYHYNRKMQSGDASWERDTQPTN